GFGRHLSFDVHRLLPVHPVAIANQQRDRRAGRHAMPNTREHLGAVAFDLHPSSTAVTALEARELRVQRVDIDFEAGGQAIERHDQRLAVRLAGSQKPQHLRSILYEGSAYFRMDGASCRRIRVVRPLASQLGMGGLLRDRYFEYAPDKAWDLVTGEAVRTDAHDESDARRPAPRSLVEVFEHGVDGSPRWIVLETNTTGWPAAHAAVA